MLTAAIKARVTRNLKSVVKLSMSKFEKMKEKLAQEYAKLEDQAFDEHISYERARDCH